MFMNFSIFLLWAVYPSMVIHQEQCIFVTIYIYDSASRERTIFNNYPTLIELEPNLFPQLDRISSLLQRKSRTSK